MKVESTEIDGRKVFSVRAFNQGIASWLERLPTVWIEGEVTELRRQERWASVFFTLKDPENGTDVALLDVRRPAIFESGGGGCGTVFGVEESAVAAADGASDLEAAATGGVEATVLDTLEAAVPQLKLFVAAADSVRALPGLAPADVDSPVRRATEENPYSGNSMGVDDDDE